MINTYMKAVCAWGKISHLCNLWEIDKAFMDMAIGHVWIEHSGQSQDLTMHSSSPPLAKATHEGSS